MLETAPSPILYDTNPDEAQQLIKIALAAEPRLTAFGFGVYDEAALRRKHGSAAVDARFKADREELRSSVEHVQRCADWIKRQKAIKSFNERYTSYSYKHMVERWWKTRNVESTYVTNGAFIAAAIGLGWETKWVDSNALFKFSEEGVHSTQISSVH